MEKIEEILKERLEADFNKYYIEGVMAGWDACCEALYALCKSETNAKSIKAILKAKADESKARNSNKSEPTP